MFFTRGKRILSILLSFVLIFTNFTFNIEITFAEELQSNCIVGSQAINVYNNMYTVGGKQNDKYCVDVTEYNYGTKEKSIKKSMINSRAYFGITNYKDTIYVLGGECEKGFSKKVEFYDIDKDQWFVSSDMPVAKSNFDVVQYYGKIYVIGGITELGISNSVEVYDIDKNSWSVASNMPTSRAKHGAVIYEDMIYVVGGVNDKGDTINSTMVYDLRTNKWTTKSNLNVPREGLGLVKIDDNIYAVGGENLNSVEVYYPKQDRWCLTKPIKGNDISQTVTVYKGNMYLTKTNGNGISIDEYVLTKIEDILLNMSKFSQLSSEDKKIICNYYNIEERKFLKYEQKGYSVDKIINASYLINKYNLPKEKFEVIAKNEVKSLNEQLFKLSCFNKGEKLPKQKLAEFKELVLQGNKFENLREVYTAANIVSTTNSEIKGMQLKTLVDISNENLIKDIEVKNNMNQANMNKFKVSEETVKAVATIRKGLYGENSTYLYSNVKENLKKYNEVNSTNATNNSTGSNLDYLSNYESYLRSAFNKKGEDRVEANTGSLNYDYPIANLSGKNDFDLDISLAYNSQSSALKEKDLKLTMKTYDRTYYPWSLCINTEQVKLVKGEGGRWEHVCSDTQYDTCEGEYNSRSIAEEVCSNLNHEIENPVDVKEFDNEMYLTYVYYTVVQKEITETYEMPKYDNISIKNSDYDCFRAGLGWRFNFPYIENRNEVNKKYIHLNDGRVYKLNGTTLEDYKLEDLKLYDQDLSKDIPVFTDDETKITSKYVLVYKDKTKQYFMSDGKLLAIKDEFGNRIKFQYVEERGNKVIKIKDTRNRVVKIVYEGNSVNVISQNNKMITLKLKELDYSGEKIKLLESISEKNVSGTDERKTSFEYKPESGSFSYISKNTGESNIYANLIKVNSYTGAHSEFNYEKVKGDLGTNGYFDYFRVIDESEYAGSKGEKPLKNKYVYEEDYTKQRSYKTNVEAICEDGKIIKKFFYFDNRHNKYKEEMYDKNNNRIIESLFQYDSRNMPTEVKITQFSYGDNNSKSGECFTKEKYEYDKFGNEVEHVDVKGEKIFNEYDSKYNQLESSRGNINGKEYKIVKNVIDADNGRVSQNSIYNYVDGKEIPIITTYKYDTCGRMIHENKQYEKPEITEYSYEDDCIYEKDKVYKVTSKNKVTDYNKNEQEIETSKIYDYNSDNLIWDIDGNGNKKRYEYDHLGRLIKSIGIHKAEETSSSVDCKSGICYKQEEQIEDNISTLPKVSKYNVFDNLVTEFHYIDNENKVIVKEKNGYHKENIYDGLGRLIESREKKLEVNKDVDKLGEQDWIIEKKEYDNLGNVIKTIDANGNETKFKYDELNKNIETVYPNDTAIVNKYYIEDNNAVVEDYDEEGNLKKTYIDKFGNKVKEITTTKVDDGYNNTIPKDCQTCYVYDDLNRLIEVTDANGNSTSNRYDYLGNLIEVKNSLGQKTKYQYNLSGKLIKVITAGNSVTSKEYDELGRLTSETDPLGKTEYIKYDKAGNIQEKIDKSKKQTIYNYDNQNRVIMEKKGNITLQYHYKDKENKKFVDKKIKKGSDNIIERSQYEYFGNGSLKKEITPDNKFISYEYDNCGNKVKETDHFAKTTSYKYSKMDRLRSVIVDRKRTIYDYTKNGKVQGVSYPNGNFSVYTYTNDGYISNLINRKSDNTVINKYMYTYDAVGNQISKTVQNSSNDLEKTIYKYDSLNRVKSVKEPGELVTSYDYDANGNILNKFISKNGNSISNSQYHYDLSNKLIESKDTNVYGKEVKILTLTADKQKISDKDAIKVTVSGEYTDGTKIEDEFLNQAIWKSYGKSLKLLETEGKSISVSYEKSSDFSIINVKVGNISACACVKEDGVKVIKSLTINSDKSNISYGDKVKFTLSGKYADGTDVEDGILDKAVWSCSNRHVQLSNIGGKRSEANYIKDVGSGGQVYYMTTPNSNLVKETSEDKIEEANNCNLTKENHYLLREFICVKASIFEIEASKTIYGEPIIINNPGIGNPKYPTTNLNIEANQIDDITEHQKINSDEASTLSNYGIHNKANSSLGKITITTRYCYDDNGNLKKKSVISGDGEQIIDEYSYNELNQLVFYKNKVNGSAKYDYYADGLRKCKTVNGQTTNFYNDGDNTIIESDEQGNLKKRYTIGLSYIRQQDAKQNDYYYLYNVHGDVTVLTDSRENTVNNYDYDIYGKKNTEKTKENVENSIRYSGEYCDEESGLYYLRARYYDPKIMRFISEDTYRGDIREPLSLNLYTYCEGNPITYKDPNGNGPIGTVIGAGGGALLGKLVADHYHLTGAKRKATIAGFAIGGAAVGWFAGPIVNKLALKTVAKLQVAGWAVAGKVGSYANFAKQATKNANSTEVVLGKFNQDGVSYVKVAQERGATYFQLDNWDSIVKKVGESNIWNINKSFLQQQARAGKVFILSHNPIRATGYYAKEIYTLKKMGYRFIREGSIWRAIK